MSGGCRVDKWSSSMFLCLFLLISLISLALRSRCVGYFLSNNFALFSSIFLAACGKGTPNNKSANRIPAYSQSLGSCKTLPQE